LQTLYNEPGVVQASFDDANKTVIARWDVFPATGHFRPALEAQLDCVEKQGCQFIIVDVSKTQGVPTQEDQKWLGEVVFPGYEKAGLRAVVTIVPEDALTKLGASRWKKTGSDFNFAMFEVSSMADAEACIRDMA